MKLYGNEISSATSRVRIALALKALKGLKLARWPRLSAIAEFSINAPALRK